MTEHSNPHHGSKGRLLRVPPRKGLWLFDYDQVKYTTPFQRTVSGILGCMALIFGTLILWVMWSSKAGNAMTALLAVAALAYGLINAPVGIVSWFRRSRGEATDYFDYEVVDPGHEDGKGVDDAPDHR
jgi:hypothetical protein